MRIGRWAAAAILLAACAGSAEAGSSRAFESEFGAARAPIGFLTYCAADPSACKTSNRRSLISPRIDASPDNLAVLANVTAYVNKKIKAVSDQELYGEVEHWAIPVDAGDCEDFVLLKKRYLEQLGFASQALLITVVLDEHNEGHAVLTVATKAGDYILDNRRDQVLRWSDTKYTFLKRQSASDPMQWVALDGRNKAPVAAVATRAGQPR